MWRDTARPARIGIPVVKPDARLSLFLLLFALHMKEWTAAVAGTAAVFFAAAEHLGFGFETVFLALRAVAVGRIRPASREWIPRSWFFYGR